MAASVLPDSDETACMSRSSVRTSPSNPNSSFKSRPDNPGRQARGRTGIQRVVGHVPDHDGRCVRPDGSVKGRKVAVFDDFECGPVLGKHQVAVFVDGSVAGKMLDARGRRRFSETLRSSFARVP